MQHSQILVVSVDTSKHETHWLAVVNSSHRFWQKQGHVHHSYLKMSKLNFFSKAYLSRLFHRNRVWNNDSVNFRVVNFLQRLVSFGLSEDSMRRNYNHHFRSVFFQQLRTFYESFWLVQNILKLSVLNSNRLKPSTIKHVFPKTSPTQSCCTKRHH